MPSIAIVGSQWGDEGKGKIVDVLAEKADMVARYSGGTNAGHTVIFSGGTFKMHLIPSGIFYPQVTCIMGNGMVIDPPELIKEIKQVCDKGIKVDNRLFISERAHLIMPYHIVLDGLEEEQRGGSSIGTTRRGIGPAYVDKVARTGIRVGDLTDKNTLIPRLRSVVEQKNNVLTRLYGAKPLVFDEIYQQCCSYGEYLAPFIRETNTLIREALDNKKLVLLEGAQGALLDIDYGTYPYVTSSSAVAGGACTGLGLSPTRIDYILGIFKVYVSRVGAGPMPTELKDETGELIRDLGHEYGTTTGRPRRCGWFDGVAARFSAQINGTTHIALTRLDILDTLPKVKICTGYRVDGKVLHSFPDNINILERCEPILEELEGWQSSTKNARRLEDLPHAARTYVARLGNIIGCPIATISVGQSREQVVIVQSLPS